MFLGQGGKATLIFIVNVDKKKEGLLVYKDMYIDVKYDNSCHSTKDNGGKFDCCLKNV